MCELDFCREIERNIGKQCALDRIETGAICAGRPDLDYCFLGYQGQIELKYINRPGKLKDNFIRPAQVQWFKNRIKHGGYPLLFTKLAIKERVEYLIHYGWQVEELAHISVVADYVDTAPLRWFPSMDWNALLSLFVSVNETGAKE